MTIKEAVDRIKQLTEAFVDANYRQGRGKVLEQLKERTSENESGFVDMFIKDSQEAIVELAQTVAPHSIPEDYVFFLEFYGGLAIETDSYYFSILGIGPMVEDWYSAIDSDEAFPEAEKYGFLSLGMLSFRSGKYKSQYVDFFLDLGGNVQKYCVIAVGPWGKDDPNSFTIIKDIRVHPRKWHKIANSFTQWLEKAAETQGGFGYN